MSANKPKGPIVDPGLCRCCGSLKKCRILNAEYEWLGQREVYSEIFVDCFGLMLSHLEGPESERVICATCVVRLRDARAFRHQVLQCEERLLNASIQVHEVNINDQQEDLKCETEVKIELEECTQKIEEEAEVNNVLEDDGHGVDLDDHDSIKSEPQPKPKKSPKTKKKIRTKTSKRKTNGTYTEKISRRKLRSNEEEEMEPGIQIQDSKKHIDTDQKSFSNTVTIVENSYVCPFDTSFSDYYCIYCREVFTDPNKLREHTLTHDPTTFKNCITNKKLLLIDIYKIDCRLCPRRFDDIDIFKSHLTTTHGKTLYDMSNDFLKFRLTVTNLTCTECNSSFSFFHALKKHMAEHFGTCICDVCGAHYFEERMLILHQKTHQKVEESFPCKDCGKIFKSKHSRFLHEAKLHKKEPAYQCYKCDEVLFSYSLRYRHMIEVHGEQRMFPCEHCDRAYDSRKSLREHNRRYHLKIFKHQCELCEKRFYLPSRLKEHMATHTGERNFRCEFCGKSYPRLRGLKVHMQSHSNEKKYRCVMCNASFTQNFNLKNHMKRQHQNLDMEEVYPE
ncbi:oocyte zinc finger protein XlCOF6-like isoform X2 [Trichoplusia ni]|uniref:Oocyte zinc finger protein XlCOF6-like isoform X2 n=1 Tax=Trichoplusia ni TaxID=7111 RepID=A0A7E5WSZ3_TRINI|nr:oocyte zinc finger protein XlCOF6-like isoform X2 [Trichoplusia ni]